MNLLLLTPADLIDDNRARVTGRQKTHLQQVHRVTIGDSVKIGVLNGRKGLAQITGITDEVIEMDLSLEGPPPPALPLTLIIALPRPKMLKRILQTIATMGVKRLIFINSYRVEKSYWHSPLLSEEKIREQLILGLEQAGDTVMPEVHLKKLFKPFVEDELPELCQGKRALVAHPYNASACPQASEEETLLAIGPEGGFIPYEVSKLEEAGCSAIHLGQRILRTETAVPVLLAKLF